MLRVIQHGRIVWEKPGEDWGQRIGGLTLFIFGIFMVMRMNFPWLIGGFFAVVGLLVLLGHEKVVVHLQSMKIVKSIGLIIPLYIQETNIAAANCVFVSFKECISRGGPWMQKYRQYSVVVKTTAASVRVAKTLDRFEALNVGAHIARLLGVELVDRSC